MYARHDGQPAGRNSDWCFVVEWWRLDALDHGVRSQPQARRTPDPTPPHRSDHITLSPPASSQSKRLLKHICFTEAVAPSHFLL